MVPRQSPVCVFLTAGLVALGAAGCSDPVTGPTPVVSARASLSVAAADPGTPTDEHLFVMNGSGIPMSFGEEVVAKGGTVVRVHDETGLALVKGLSDAAADELARGIGKVHRDVMLQWAPRPEDAQAWLLAEEASSDVMLAAGSPFAAVFLPLQWNMRQIHAPEAWATRTGDPRVRVAILDTGLDPDHIDQANLIDQASSIAFIPSVTGPPAWADDHYHGTHVGGLVVTNNIGTAGVAPNVTLIAIKVTNAAGQVSLAAVFFGLIHAGDVRADVANLSLGGPVPKSGAGPLVAAFNRAVNYANRHGVLVVSAAGNENADLQHNGNVIYIPCESGTGMCVSSTGPTDTKSSFSNYGVSAIDVAAPGGEAGPPPTSWVLSLCSSRSAMPGLAPCRSRGRYIFLAGTSQATPHVSGTAALHDSQYGGALNPAQLQTALQQCSDDIGKPGTDPYYGKGRVNVFKTVNEVDCNNSAPKAAARLP